MEDFEEKVKTKTRSKKRKKDEDGEASNEPKAKVMQKQSTRFIRSLLTNPDFALLIIAIFDSWVLFRSIDKIGG